VAATPGGGTRLGGGLAGGAAAASAANGQGTPGIDTSGVSAYDEFGQPYAGTKTAQVNPYDEFGQQLNTAISAAAVPRSITIVLNGVTPKDIAQEIYDNLEPLLVQGGGSGTVAGLK
jgi:hypothetical protein